MISKKLNFILKVNTAGLIFTIFFFGWFIYNFGEVSLHRSRDSFQQAIEKQASDSEIKEAGGKIIRAINHNQGFIRYLGLVILAFNLLMFIVFVVNLFSIRRLRKLSQQSVE